MRCNFVCVFLPKHSHYSGYTAIINFALTAIEKLFVWVFLCNYLFICFCMHTQVCVCYSVYVHVCVCMTLHILYTCVQSSLNCTGFHVLHSCVCPSFLFSAALGVYHPRATICCRGYRAALASAHQAQPLPQTLSVLESTPQVRGMHTIIR